MVRGKTSRGGRGLPGRHRFPPTAAAGLRLAASAPVSLEAIECQH
jgi:hypothetical protein